MITIAVNYEQLLLQSLGNQYGVCRRSLSYVEVASKYLMERGIKSLYYSQYSVVRTEVA